MREISRFHVMAFARSWASASTQKPSRIAARENPTRQCTLNHLGWDLGFHHLGRFSTPVLANVLHDDGIDRKSTRLNSSHVAISYAVYCLKKKKKNNVTKRKT